jgi:hypothetical protein
MKPRNNLVWINRGVGVAVLLVAISSGRSESLQEGARIFINGRRATLKKVVSLPYVENDYTKRFKFDSFANPKLKQLRERYKLDDVIAPGKDEFDKQVLLMDWTHRQFKKFGRPSTGSSGALDILQAALSLAVEGGTIRVLLKTLTPNFKQYEIRIDGADWRPSPDSLTWNTHPGLNRIEARTINQFGVAGPASLAELEITN